MTQEVQAEQPQEWAPIESMEQLGFLIANWHRERMHHLLAIVEKPEALALKEAKEDGTEVPFSDRDTLCFAMGVEYALNLFKDLPIKSEMETVDEAHPENSGDGSIV